MPSLRSRPVAVVTGRRNFTVRSIEVEAVPAGSRLSTAQAQAESSSVANTPPCTEPVRL